MTAHHVEALSQEGKKQYEKARVEHAKKSPERKKDKKGKGKGGKARFNTLGEGKGGEEAQDDITEESKAATALKLMAKLLPLTEGEENEEDVRIQ